MEVKHIGTDIVTTAMDRAIELSIENAKERKGGPFAAIIIKNNEIISEGQNEVTSTYDPSNHAEIMAIRKACQKLKTHNLSGCILISSCYSCSMCYSCAKWAGIDTIYYCNTREEAACIGFHDLKIYEEIKDIMNGKEVANIIRIQNPKAIEAFKIWDADKDKIVY
jgi:tRNA(Arg) A34 adenosine deaminase TadA